jgi:hypothetical protein
MMNYEQIKCFGAAIFAMSLTTIVALAQPVPSTPIVEASGPRIDVLVTPTNSVLLDFGNGAMLRVPKIMVSPETIPKDPRQSIRAEQFGFTFQFPDMVQSDYQSPLGKIVDRKAGGWEWYLPKPGRFPVIVSHLFYSTEDVTSIDTMNATRGVDWRPLDMVHMLEGHVKMDAKLHHISDAKVTFSDANGLREIHVPITDKAYHEKLLKDTKERGIDLKEIEGSQYIERVGSPYELYMLCEDPSSIKCDAYVFIKSNHFQYKMLFPPGEVAHVDKLIRTINKMIDGWSQK